MKLITAIAQTIDTLNRIDKDKGANATRLAFRPKHVARLDWLVSYMPSGSGFDAGTHLWRDQPQKANSIIFSTSFHHMDENGSYDGWTDHQIKISANLAYDLSIDVFGKNRNDILDYIADTFREACNQDGDWLNPPADCCLGGNSHHGVLFHDSK